MVINFQRLDKYDSKHTRSCKKVQENIGQRCDRRKMKIRRDREDMRIKRSNDRKLVIINTHGCVS